MNDNLKDSGHKSCGCGSSNDDYIKKSCALLPQQILDFIDHCLHSENPHSLVIAVLHKIQDHFGYLSPQSMDAVAYLMQIPAAKISGIASFYHYFRLKPCGKFVISVCLGTACYVNGSEAILNKFRDVLGIAEGETTADGIFTLEVSRCLGTCALAPVVKVGEEIHAHLTADKVPAMIEHYRAKMNKPK